MGFRVGIDIGSATVKTVVLDTTGEMVFRAYERHYSKVREKAAEQIRSASHILSGQKVDTVITGSAGLGVAKISGFRFVQEVYATASAVRKYVPNADAAIELGGEDAKIVFFGRSLEERMNGSCAGGTGAFIDQMATLLNVSITELDALSLKHERIYPIASRCGVFAKSDIQSILNQGGRREDIAASIFQAVVDQTVVGLAQGRELTGKIVFLGGPLTFLMGLRQRFVETLQLDRQLAVFPENANCFAALGAALLIQPNGEMSFDEMLGLLEHAADAPQLTNVMLPLFCSQTEYDAFTTRHNRARPELVDSDTYEGDAYIGIDAGSTTTKLVLIAANGGILYSYYAANQGDPVSIVKNELRAIYTRFGNRVKIRSSAVTGYGEDLIKNAFSVDTGLVETSAHFRAAWHFDPRVDFILDIGGQDVKCLKIHNGAIDSIMFNEACSSGCGSFIETFAQAAGYNIGDFAKIGLFDPNPVNLGSRCTVFINSSVKQAQKEGASIEAISAGLSISVVKNAVYKVIRAASADDLGKNIVVQGGTFLNDAVLRAFEQEIGRDVTRSTIAGLMGAYGAALSAKDSASNSSALLDSAALDRFSHTAKPAACHGCVNRCSMTINTFDGGRSFISGNRCSKPLALQRATEPNLMKWKHDYLRTLSGKGSGTGVRGKIGIPFGLNMYENLPLWFEFFTRLNFAVVLSPESSRKLYIRGQQTIPSDTVCYPAKLMHGHIEHLLDMGVETIFYPCMPYNFNEGKADDNYNCPVVAYYPELLAANMPRLKTVRFLAPYFGLHKKQGFVQRVSEYFRENFGIPSGETKKAVFAAYSAYDQFRKAVIEQGEKAIEYARANGKKIIVVAGRPYHADLEINHGIDELLTSYGLVLLSEDAIAHLMEKENRGVLNQWTYHARMYSAARYVVTQPDMQMVQLVSFGCGLDAITTDEMRSILENGGKLCTQIKIDDINNLSAVRIRVRSLLAAMAAREMRVEGGRYGDA